MKQVFHNTYREGNRLYTVSLDPGVKVYGERLIRFGNRELREWNPHRSKLAAAILKGMKSFAFKAESHVLYLGAAQGTTPSHISDIVDKGYVINVEISQKPMEKLIPLCERRENMAPILGDAAQPEGYAGYLDDIDIIYQDVAQPNQAKILLRNAKYLKKGGYAYLCVKARSIDVAKDPKEIFAGEAALLAKDLKVLEVVPLAPHEKDHAIVACKKK